MLADGGDWGVELMRHPSSRQRPVLENSSFGQVLLGGPGPALAYRIGARTVRVRSDVLATLPLGRDRRSPSRDVPGC